MIGYDYEERKPVLAEGWFGRTIERVLAGLIVAGIYWLIR